jgi:transposase-like protein
MRNILAKLPRLMQAKMKGLVQQVFLAPTYAPALKRGRDLIAKFKDRYPAAMECLERNLEECVTYLRFPEAHHSGFAQRIASSGSTAKAGGGRKSSHAFQPNARASPCYMRA